MKMKNFQADTMQEALSLVKEEMGPDAVILKSRRTTRRAGIKTVPCFEVTASLDESHFARPQAKVTPTSPGLTALGKAAMGLSAARKPLPLTQTVATPGMYDWKGSLRHVEEDGKSTATVRQNTQPASTPQLATGAQGSLLELLRTEIREMKDQVNAPTQELRSLKEEIRAMMDSAAARSQAAARSEAARLAALSTTQKSISRSHPNSAMQASQQNSGSHALAACLTEMDIDLELTNELVKAATLRNSIRRLDAAIGSPEAMEQELHAVTLCMKERIRVSGGIKLMPGRPTTVALVGPTGVGKTTTLAKLAALAKMQQGKKVGIISADSFRMGANEQLELFGRTAGIPVRPVFSAADVDQALRDFSKCDLILVDTAGRSHTHLEMWSELQGLLRCLHPDEIHLVLSGPTRMKELSHQYGLYRDLGATSLIFTKLDECLTLGCLYNLARRAEAPLSYLCNGQVIPDHIMLASSETVASAIATAARSEMTAQEVR